jgi:hypothetical protein
MPGASTEYVRFRSRYTSSSGLKIGVFGLVNVLGRRGMLTPDEERFRRENNDWYDAAYAEPDVYGPGTDPLAEPAERPTETPGAPPGCPAGRPTGAPPG